MWRWSWTEGALLTPPVSLPPATLPDSVSGRSGSGAPLAFPSVTGASTLHAYASEEDSPPPLAKTARSSAATPPSSNHQAVEKSVRTRKPVLRAPFVRKAWINRGQRIRAAYSSSLWPNISRRKGTSSAWEKT